MRERFSEEMTGKLIKVEWGIEQKRPVSLKVKATLE
jgi:hypothetical protein